VFVSAAFILATADLHLLQPVVCTILLLDEHRSILLEGYVKAAAAFQSSLFVKRDWLDACTWGFRKITGLIVMGVYRFIRLHVLLPPSGPCLGDHYALPPCATGILQAIPWYVKWGLTYIVVNIE
jgi:hypothetical protein